MTSETSGSDFQMKATALAQEILTAAGLEIEFEFVCGMEESYFESNIVIAGRSRIKVFVYSDEAGFYNNERWNIFETQDFPSPIELLAQFGERLQLAVQFGLGGGIGA